MPINYSTALKNARLDAVTAAAGTTAVLEICSASYASVLATFSLSNPIAPAASGGVLTLTFPKTDSSADATGTAAVARIRTSSGGTTIADGMTVGTTGTNVILASTSITSGQSITLDSAVITHAA